MKGLGGALVNMTDLTTSTARRQTGRRQTVGARSSNAAESRHRNEFVQCLAAYLRKQLLDKQTRQAGMSSRESPYRNPATKSTRPCSRPPGDVAVVDIKPATMLALRCSAMPSSQPVRRLAKERKEITSCCNTDLWRGSNREQQKQSRKSKAAECRQTNMRAWCWT